jgi:uncharacterized protein (TIGR00725 family)
MPALEHHAMTQSSPPPSPPAGPQGPSAELLEAAQAHRHAAPVVTVFGGSRVEPGSPAYQEAYEVGRLLAQHGYVVCNGGYSGTMEAASRGCKEAGGRTIGVTVEVLGRLAPNDFIDEEVGTAGLLMRLDRLTALADAYIVLGGGIGTLLELALVWNLRLMQVYPDKPIVLLGSAWRETVACFAQRLYIREVDLAAFTFAETPDAALAALARPPAERSAAPTDWRG